MREIIIKKLHNGLAGIRDSFILNDNVIIKHNGYQKIIPKGSKPVMVKKMESYYGKENDYEIFLYKFFDKGPVNENQLKLFNA